MYYQTLSGAHTTIQKIQNDNFDIAYSTKIANTNYNLSLQLDRNTTKITKNININSNANNCNFLPYLHLILKQRNNNYRSTINYGKSKNINTVVYKNMVYESPVSTTDTNFDRGDAWTDALNFNQVKIREKYQRDKVIERISNINSNENNYEMDQNGQIIQKYKQPQFYNILKNIPSQYNDDQNQQIMSKLIQAYNKLQFNEQHYAKNLIASNKPSQQQNKHLSIISKALRQVNQYQVRSQEIPQMNTTLNKSKELLQKLPALPIHHQYFNQLLSHISICEKSNNQLLMLPKIFAKFYYKYKERKQSDQLKRKAFSISHRPGSIVNFAKIYYLFIAEQPSNRVFLDRYFFQINNTQIFQIIKQYDIIISSTTNNSKIINNNYFEYKNQSKLSLLNRIKIHDQNVKKMLQKYKLKDQKVKYLAALLSIQTDFQWPAAQFSYQLMMYVLGLKLWRWLQLSVNSQQQQNIINQSIMQSFLRCRQTILSSQNIQKYPNIISHMFHLNLLSYQNSFTLLAQASKSHSRHFPTKILLLIIICLSSQTVMKLLTFSIPQQNSYKLKMSDFRTQLCQQLKRLQTDKKHEGNINLIINCIHLLNLNQSIELISDNKVIAESIDWNYLCKLIQDKHVLKQFIQQTIIRCVYKYKNVSAFINIGIPYQSLLPYFQIDVLTIGLTQIMTQNVKLNQKEKQNFFGIISTYRDIRLPENQQMKMIFLEMLVQWFLINQSMIKQDFKELAVSLRANLEPQKMHQDMQQRQSMVMSMNLTQSRRMMNSMIKLHNYEYTSRIQTKQFISYIKQCRSLFKMYIFYMKSIFQALMMIQSNEQKVIRISKVELWADIWMGVIQNNINMAKIVKIAKIININYEIQTHNNYQHQQQLRKVEDQKQFLSLLNNLRNKGIQMFNKLNF